MKIEDNCVNWLAHNKQQLLSSQEGDEWEKIYSSRGWWEGKEWMGKN